MILLYILGIILLVILILLSIIILIPYTYIIKSEEVADRIEFSILWLFGILGIRYVKDLKEDDELLFIIFNFSKKIQTNPKKEEKLGKEKKNKKDKNNKSKGIRWKDHVNKVVINKLITSFNKIWDSIKPYKYFINLQIGFNDPMYTGLLYAQYCQISYMFSRYNIHFQPIFDEKTLRGKVLVRGKVWVFYLLMVIIGFLISKPIRYEIKSIMKERGGA